MTDVLDIYWILPYTGRHAPQGWYWAPLGQARPSSHPAPPPPLPAHSYQQQLCPCPTRGSSTTLLRRGQRLGRSAVATHPTFILISGAEVNENVKMEGPVEGILWVLMHGGCQNTLTRRDAGCARSPLSSNPHSTTPTAQLTKPSAKVRPQPRHQQRLPSPTQRRPWPTQSPCRQPSLVAAVRGDAVQCTPTAPTMTETVHGLTTVCDLAGNSAGQTRADAQASLSRRQRESHGSIAHTARAARVHQITTRPFRRPR